MSILWMDRCASTQDELWSAHLDVTAVATTEQTAGRGRRGNMWRVEPHQSLALSWRAPTQGLTAERLPTLSLAAGVALHRWVTKLIEQRSEEDGLALDGSLALKWPNDLLYRSRKLAGILCEARWDQRFTTLGDDCDSLPTVLIGIGINVCSAPALPPPATPTTSLNALCAARGLNPFKIDEVSARAEDLLTELKTCVDQLRDHPHTLLDAWIERGVPVGSTIQSQGRRGVYRGIDDRGALLLDIDGVLCTVDTGEVQLVSVPPPLS